MRIRGLEFRAVRVALSLAATVLATPNDWASPRADDDPIPAARDLHPIVFRDQAATAGVSFRFHTGSRGQHDLPEIMGGGVAIFDADGDGLPDLYFCNGGPIDAAPARRIRPCRLYRNRGDWQFEDITDRAGVPGPSYAMGAAVGDYDGDGRDDLFVTGWRDQRLYRNLGRRPIRGRDATRRAGLGSLEHLRGVRRPRRRRRPGSLRRELPRLSIPTSPPFCAAPDGRRDYCGPEDFPAQADRLYRNNGDGTFTDVSKSGRDRPAGRPGARRHRSPS